MYAEPTRWILIEKRLPDFQPIGLAVAMWAPHRRTEGFHS